MNKEIEALARRAVACHHWRWMPGMRCNRGAVWFRIVDGYTIETPSLDTLPDLSDPATLGCLLALVREAHNAPHAWVETRYGKRSRVLDPQEMSEGARMLCGWTIGTEAAALVAALEAAQ